MESIPLTFSKRNIFGRIILNSRIYSMYSFALSSYRRFPIVLNDWHGGPPIIISTGKLPTNTRPGRLILDVIKDQFNTLDENRQLGYTLVGESILDAVDYGVPQHRERVFLVGARNDLLDRIHWTYPRATHGEELERYITLQEAISDFPSLSEGEKKSEYLQPLSLGHSFNNSSNLFIVDTTIMLGKDITSCTHKLLILISWRLQIFTLFLPFR